MAAQVKNMLIQRGQQKAPAPAVIGPPNPVARAVRDVNTADFGYVGPADPDRLKRALFAITPGPGDWGDKVRRKYWRACVWGFRAGGGAYDDVLEWSRRTIGYDTDDEVLKMWNSYRVDGGITAGTLIHIAKTQFGFEDHPSNREHAFGELPEQNDPKAKIVTPFVLADHIHPWSRNDTVNRSHDFLIGLAASGLLPLASVSVLASPGGMMKTALAISLLLHVAAGQAWAGLEIDRAGGMLVALEDDLDETTRRLIATLLTQIDPDKRDGIEDLIRVVALAGIDARLTANLYGSSHRTHMAEQIISAAKAQADATGHLVRLIVFDHARLVIGGDANDSGHVTELMRALSHIAKETGAAVVLLCHSPKSTVNPNRVGDYSASDVLGSGAFVDNSRNAFVMSTLTDDERKDFSLSPDGAKKYVALRVIKSNYSETGRVFYLRKTPVDGWGVVVPDVVNLSKPVRERAVPVSNTDKVMALIQRFPGRFTRTAFKLQTGKVGPLGICEKAATAALSGLIAVGRVGLRVPTQEEIKSYNLSRQAKEVLYVIGN